MTNDNKYKWMNKHYSSNKQSNCNESSTNKKPQTRINIILIQKTRRKKQLDYLSGSKGTIASLSRDEINGQDRLSMNRRWLGRFNRNKVLQRWDRDRFGLVIGCRYIFTYFNPFVFIYLPETQKMINFLL